VGSAVRLLLGERRFDLLPQLLRPVTRRGLTGSRQWVRTSLEVKEPEEHHGDAAARQRDGDEAGDPVGKTLAIPKARAEQMEEAEYLPPGRYPSAAVGEPRLRASFVAVFVCRKMVERAEQLIESVGESCVDATPLRRRRVSSRLG
jgi:hypothetical protein